MCRGREPEKEVLGLLGRAKPLNSCFLSSPGRLLLEDKGEGAGSHVGGMPFPHGGKYSFMSPVTNPVLSGVQRKQSSGFRIYYFPLVRSSFSSNSPVLMLASLEGWGAPGDFGHSVQLWSLLWRPASGAQQENTGRLCYHFH